MESSEEEADLQQAADGPPKPSWKPCGTQFRRYFDGESRGTIRRPGPLRVAVGKSLVVRLTKDLLETYQFCNPTFSYSDSFNPRRYLTNPSNGVLNDGADNANSDLILAVNAVLLNADTSCRYIVKDLLGQGTFGQVAKCWVPEMNNFVAVKVIKNQPAYYHQALVEISILNMLNKKFDPEDKHHIVRVLDHFVCQRHLCIAFEMLGVNLFELLKLNQYRGISLNLLRLFAKQILDALLVLREASVIHCDLKPENILLTTSLQSAEIKLIDFGSACMENRTVYSYIQSRFYRSPEVLLGHPYTTAIDMWSFGCIVAELFLGLPLFPGASEYDLIKRMIEILGGQPPDHILRSAKNTSKYFKHVGASSRLDENRAAEGQQSAYQFLTEMEYESREMKKPAIAKRYFNFETLEDIVINYPHRKKITEEEISRETHARWAFIDFLRGLVEFDPVKRWTPRQAAQHPFVTEEAFMCPYKPAPETPRTPVCQIVMVDHNPGSGHWFGAGLSPQVMNTNMNMNKGMRYNSPQYQLVPLSYPSSYGSLGSHGSYGDGGGLGSSFGSYGDTGNVYTGYCPVAPSGLNSQNQGHVSTGLGASPDTRWRVSQVPPGHALGISPSSVMFRPMSLGASPSQFTPPSSQMLVSSGSPIGSPGRYGPTSPARSGMHATGLGKAAAVGQYHKRRGLGMPGSLHLPTQESAPQHWQGNMDMSASNSVDGTNRGGYMGSPRGGQGNSHFHPWRQKGGNNTNTTSGVSNTEKTTGICAAASTESSSEGLENNSPPPDPGDWDPNYSDDLLLQEDGSEVISPRSSGSVGIRSNQALGSASSSVTGVGRYGRSYSQLPISSSSNSNAHRSNGLVQGHANVEGSPPSVHGMQPGYNRAISKPSHHGPYSTQQNSLSRLGQQSSQVFQQPIQQQYRPTSMLHPDLQLPSNMMGQHLAHQSTSMGQNQISNGGKSSIYPPSSTQRDSRAEYTQVRGIGSSISTGAHSYSNYPQDHVMENTSHGLPGMPRVQPQSFLANEISWGQRTGHPFTGLPSSIHGRRDYRRIG
uniref:Protein kinase domain-containing protein n=1 Tax=Araucaria cunninghamii TaxID=56994 RepID=A0A0D6R4L1_ARACU